ncbi:hypothetical protein [Cetobacterium sp.]|uniref:hypothetical protein n=1 Tax=Cetobacterium sp. TaxID=2071632 RepID=UPI002FC7CA54
MNINNYILKTEKKEIKLEEYIDLLNNDDDKNEIIDIFITKFKEDYTSSIDLLLENKKMYTASLVIVSAIDILAKHYSGSDKLGGVGERYKKFLEIYFKELIGSFDLEKEIYTNFRCGITHSNSSAIDFTLDSEIKTFESQDGRKVINLGWLLKKLKEVIKQYKKELLEVEDIYINFLNVERNLYCEQIKGEK